METFKFWRKDLAAALSVSFVAIPQALAYAAMAGLPPHIGLYAASVPTFVAAFFGTSKVLSTGPFAIISLLTAASLAKFSQNPSELIGAAVVLSLTVGLIQIFLGILRLGSLINFIAHPVLAGFTTAAAFIIWFSQIPKLVGITVANHQHFYQVFLETMQRFPELDLGTAAIGIGSIIAITILRKFTPKLPAALIVIIAGTIISAFFHYGGSIVGTVPQGFALFDIRTIIGVNPTGLLTNALIIAVVGFVSSMSTVKQLSVQTRDKINPNREFIAQGFANVASGIVGAFPVGGSVSRTALNLSAGAQTKLSSMLLGILCLLFMFALTPLLYYITYASLAAIIMVAVFDLIDVKEIVRLIRTQMRDGVVAIITLISTLFFAPHLDIGIIVGIIASVLAHMHRSANPHLEIFFCHDVDYLHSHHYHLKTYPSNEKVLGVSIHSSLSFANASLIHERILSEVERYKKKPKYVLLIASSISEVDASAEKILLTIHHDLKDQKIQLLFAGIKPHVEESLKKTEFYDFVGGSNIYPEVNLALKAINDREVNGS